MFFKHTKGKKNTTFASLTSDPGSKELFSRKHESVEMDINDSVSSFF